MISSIISLASSTSPSALNHTTLLSLTPAIELNATTSNYLYTPSTTIDLLNASSLGNASDNDSSGNGTFDMGSPVFPGYIRTTSMVFCIIIMCLGVVGNVMVPIVIFKTKDMRNSTNIFLVNLSVADLMVLLVCTPTVLVEVNSKPETWVLGEEMCKAVPFVELTVAHASVLTILAISFERYYAICKPLEAGYICTKARASLICLLAWIIAAVFTSPMLSIAEYKHLEYFDGSKVPACHTLANTFWSALYFLSSIFLFFIVPFIVLIILYCIIAKNLISNAANLVLNKHIDNYSMRARRQVILMLGTVVLSFFLCLIPFRVFILWIIVVPEENVVQLGAEKYYNILYFCRIMVYLNSAINPILYNLMSSKFRTGFIICSDSRRKLYFKRARNGTFSSTTANSCRSSTLRNSHEGYKVCYRPRNSSILLKNCSHSESPESNRSSTDSHSHILIKESPIIHRSSATLHQSNLIERGEIDSNGSGNRIDQLSNHKSISIHRVFEGRCNRATGATETINLREKFLKQKALKVEDESFV